MNSPSSYTVIYGDNVRLFRLGYAFASSLTLAGTMGEAVQLSAELVAQDLDESVTLYNDDGVLKFRERVLGSGMDVAGSVWEYPDPYSHIQNMVALRTEFFIADSLEELFGQSARRKGYLRSWEFSLQTGRAPFYTTDGGQDRKLAYRVHSQALRTVELSLSYISQEETWDREFAAWLNGRGRWVRLVVHGPTLDAMPLYNRFFELVTFIRYDDSPEIFADEDGKAMLSFTARSYDPHQDRTEVSAKGSGWPEPGVIADATGTKSDLEILPEDNFDFMIRVQNHKQMVEM